jgi:preprotein translocase subunit SecA
MFQEMMHTAREEIIGLLFKAQIVHAAEEEIVPQRRAVTYGGPAKEAVTPTHRQTDKIGRNDPCPCGSGKKYKKCCLLKKGK